MVLQHARDQNEFIGLDVVNERNTIRWIDACEGREHLTSSRSAEPEFCVAPMNDLSLIVQESR